MFASFDFLKGVRIADFCWAGAGPFGTKVFSDLGAEVIKLESSTRIDSVRMGGPYKDGVPGVNRSGYFASRNSGKKSVTVDLKKTEGREIALKLIEKSDVVTNNFGPQVMQRLGLGYEDIIKVKPDIIHLSMPMYGQSGPYSSLLGVGMTISAVTGITGLMGYADGVPVGPGTHYPDHAANPYHAAFSIMSCLRYRKLTGKGMQIDLSQVESTINFIGPAILRFQKSGGSDKLSGNQSKIQAPHNLFKCKGEDDWCAIAAQTDAEWESLAFVIGGRDLVSNNSFLRLSDRIKNIEDLESIISTWTHKYTVNEVVTKLEAAGVTVSRVATSEYLLEEDVHLKERNFWQSVDHAEVGVTTFTSPPYMIDGKRVMLKPPPLLGEHTEECLKNILNYSDDEIRHLIDIDVLR